VENADGDFIAFIDDDEFPVNNWLLALFDTCNQYNVDGVLGPVRRHFDEKPHQVAREEQSLRTQDQPDRNQGALAGSAHR
jgi:hypothetical protein